MFLYFGGLFFIIIKLKEFFLTLYDLLLFEKIGINALLNKQLKIKMI